MGRLTQRVRNHVILNDDGTSYTEALEKLAEYEDLEEQGRLKKLPCRIGDKAYIIIDHKIFEEKLVEAVIWYRTEYYGFDESLVGQDLFFTREGAEEALRKIKENKK